MGELEYYYVLEKDDTSIINKLYVDDVFDVKDRSGKRLILSKLLLNNNEKCRFYIETNFYKVYDVDSKNRITVSIDKTCEDVFTCIDNRCIELLDGLLNNKDEIFNVVIDGDLDFNTLVKDCQDDKLFKVQVEKDTSILLNNKTTALDTIKKGDMVRFLVGIESINLYPDEKVSFVKTYCHIIQVYHDNSENLTRRNKISNYKFSTDINSMFEKIVLQDQDIDFVKTDSEKDDKVKIVELEKPKKNTSRKKKTTL